MNALNGKLLVSFTIAILLLPGCGKEKDKKTEIPAVGVETPVNEVVKTETGTVKKEEKKEQKIKVTFIELGSVNCIPCKMMKPVMEEVEKEYGDQVKVVFHDVWTEEGKPYAQQYGIRAIPTQVFLDKDGKEFYRHMGFFAKEELVKILKMKGVE